MAQAPRSSSSTIGLSDDPLENTVDWLTANRRMVMIVVVVIIAFALLIFGYRALDESKRQKAFASLEQAQSLIASENPKGAATALERVVKNYGGTSAGQQAALLLAQVRYDDNQREAGIKELESAVGSASDEFKPSFEQLIAMGYEGENKHVEAAAHYAKAAELTKFPAEKAQYQAAQARQLTEAGKLDDALAIWVMLRDRDDTGLSQEAAVRIGEIRGMAK